MSWVEASRFDPATAYATIDRHSFGDMGTYLYRTTDFGKTWSALVTPQTDGIRGYAHVIREDTVSPNLLFLGTEFGLWVSLDAGASWAPFHPGNFPAVAVRDMVVQARDNDLVIATHGRGIWIVDDISPLRSLSARTLDADVTLLPGRPVQQRIRANGGWVEGDASFSGDNPADGAVISYYLRTRQVIGKLSIDILDASGAVVDSIAPGKRKGLNRVVWSMRTKAPLVPPAAQIAGASTQGPRVLPGTYTVRLTKSGTVYTMPLIVGLDRRAAYTTDDRAKQFAEANRVKDLFARMSVLVGKINALRGQTAALSAKLAATDPLRARLATFSDHADDLRKLVVATKEGGAITGEQRLREETDDVYGAINGTEGAPTAYAVARVDTLDRELADVEKRFAALVSTDLPGLNEQLKSKSLPSIGMTDVPTSDDVARGGPIEAIYANLLGTRLRGTLPQTAEGMADTH